MNLLKKIKEAIVGESTDFKKLLNEGAVVVDVRTPREFKSGHVRDSENIPLKTFTQQMERLAGKKVILVCQSGGRAGQAKNILRSCGVEAYNAGPWQRISKIKES